MEKLDTVDIFNQHRTKHRAVCTYEYFVPLKRRIAGTSQCYDNAFAIFIGFICSESHPLRQLYVVFTVRDDHLVAAGEPRILEHRMSEPTSIDDGQTLLGGAKSETGRSYVCLLDVDSGEQRPLKVDSSGRPVKSDLYTSRWVRRGSEQM